MAEASAIALLVYQTASRQHIIQCNRESSSVPALKSKLLTHSELCDADPVAQGDGGGFGQGAPGLEAAGARVGVAVAHSFHQRRQQTRLAAEPRPRPWTGGDL